MPEPGNNRPGNNRARSADRGRMRASHADREQVVDILKDAFVQDRLTKDEFDSRVGDALASRTHADLAALTADLPARPPAPRLPRAPVPARPQRSENATIKTGARVIAVTTVLTVGVWAGALVSNADSQAVSVLTAAFTFLWFGIVCLVGAVMLDSQLQKRSGRQLPPASGDGDGDSDSDGDSDGDGGPAPRRTASAHPARPLRPGGNGAEASRLRTSRPSLLLEPRVNPS
jgi:Domain of unknown function (DUF1707)